MNFKIINGQGILYIGCFLNVGDYFNYKRPITLAWYDRKGSVAQFIATLPYSKEYREKFLYLYREGLSKNYSEDINDLYTLLSPLWMLFENGEYELEYINSINDWMFIFEEGVENSNKFKKIKEYQAYKVEMKKKDSCSCSLVKYTSGISYPFPDVDIFLATQPKNILNKERVKEFEELIKKGERPFILIFRAYLDESPSYFGYSNQYVLDGHHKLEAYKNLKMNPPIVRITRDYDKEWDQNEWKWKDGKTPLLFDMEALKKSLYSWQFKHLLEGVKQESEN